MFSKEEKARRAKECQNCYFCEQGIDKTVSVDDKKQPTAPQKQTEKDKLCQNCYRCEQGIDKSVTADTLKKGSGKSRDELCVNCYRCEQGIDKSVTADDVKKGVVTDKTPFCWYLFPTNACNLRCDYCYANNKPGKMTRDTMHQMLKWLFVTQPYKNLTCHFFGGEPTIMWDMMVDIVQLGNELADAKGRKVTWSMTSNGTLLASGRLDWIAKNFRNSNPFLLSIDGRPETHDKHRVTSKKEGSFEMIPLGEILQRFPNIECRPTIEPDTAKDWFEDFKFLRNQGFKSIAIEPDYECEWTAEQLRDYENTLRQLGKYYIYALRNNQPIYMKWIDGVKSRLGADGMPTGVMCGTCNNSGAVDHLGYLYACQRYASYNEPTKYAIGDVWNGWDEYKLFETRLLLRETVIGDISQGNHCPTCSARFYCMKGCNAANIKIMGDRHVALPMYCVLARIEVGVALEVLNDLGLLAKKQGGVCKV